jgi:hypothetical protein
MTFERGLRVACVALAGWLFAALALIAAAHADDGYRLDHVSGVWMGLARYAADGTLYPELYDGEHFGGTRFMPLQFLVHGALSEATGELVVSGKALAFAAGAALLATTFLVLRRVVGAPTWLALSLPALLVPTQLGLSAITSIRGDVLPVVFQLAAVSVVERSTGRRAVLGAAALCVVAVLCKLTAVWAPLAIIVWLAARERRRVPEFAAAFALALLGSLLVVEVVSEGRFSDNVLGLAGSALASRDFLVEALTTKPLTLLESDAAAIFVVLPLAIADVALSWRARRVGVFHVAFVSAALATVAVMADIGAVSNHLLDISVLTVVLVGHLYVEFGDSRPSAVRVLVPVALLWAALGSYVTVMHGDVKAAARDLAGRSERDSLELLRRHVPREGSVLSEDARIDLDADRDPVILDPFMLLRLLDEHPEWETDLVERVERRDFDWVVLRRDHVLADGSIEVDNARWRREHFGRPVVAAIDRDYRFRAFAGAYAIYEPAS